MIDDRATRLRSAAGVALCSLLSPLTGLAVEFCLARVAGAAAAVDAYRATSTILTIGNQLFFGAVTIQVLVPLLCECNTRGLQRAGKRTAILFGLVLFILTLPVLYVAIAAPKTFLLLLVPGAGPKTLASGQLQLRVFGCTLLPMLWAGVLSAFLQSRRIFWITAIAQSFNNVAIIALLLLSRRADYSLAAGNFFGYTAMLALHLVYFRRGDRLETPDWREPCRQTLRAIRLAIPAFLALLPPLGGAAIILRTLSAAPRGTLAECGFAGKPGLMVSLLPSVLFTIMLPELSIRKFMHPEAFAPAVQRMLRFALLVTLPLTAILMVLRHPLINALLFGGHALGPASLDRIATYFAILAIGGPAAALSAATGQICAALFDTRAGLWAICVSSLLTVAIVPSAGRHFGPRGVMAAISAAAWMICAWYAAYAKIVHGVAGWSSLAVYALRVSVAASAAAALIAVAEASLLYRLGGNEFGAATNLAIAGALAALTVYLVGLTLGLRELQEIAALVRWPLGRGAGRAARA